MKLLIEIAAAALLIVCISVSSAAYAGPTADGKFYANYCGDKLLSAVK